MSTTAERTPTRRARTVALWALQIVLAVQFAGAGLLKLSGDPAQVEMFTAIGAGQWLRVVVGVLEVVGAVGVLVTLLAGLAAAGLAALMVGATVTNVVVLGVSPVMPAVPLVIAAFVAWVRRRQLPRLAVPQAHPDR